MKQLSDLLWEAKSDAPPPRYDVDDMVAAGRRRRQRRHAVWGVAAAAVLATVGVVLVVPRPTAVVPPALPSPAPSLAPGSFYVSSFHGYRAGDFVVADPDGLELGSDQAAVRSTRAGYGDPAANLTVYLPGVQPIELGWKQTPAAPINGRPAYYLNLKGSPEALQWENTDGSVALLSATGSKMSRADLWAVAAAFVPGGGRELRVPMTVGYLPADYRVIFLQSPGGRSFAQLVPTAIAETMMARPDRNLSPGRGGNLVGIDIGRVPDGQPTPKEVVCGKTTCTRTLDGIHRVSVYGLGITVAEKRKIAEQITVGDLGDPSAWPTVGEAFPTSALFTGDR